MKTETETGSEKRPYTRIEADNDKLRYSGRIDWSNPKEPVFIFPCTSVKMKFSGNILRIHVRNRRAYWDNYLGCILDGRQSAIRLPEEGSAVLELPVAPAEDGTHEVLLFKRQDSCHELAFLGFEIAGNAEALQLPAEGKRKIEVYGDSVSAGEVSEAVDFTGKEDPEHCGEYSNSWYSYAWITARKLNAQIHNIAQGGIALLDGTGWFSEPEYIGMEKVWDKVHYNPAFGKVTEWDFSRYLPQVVIVAVGQNDSHPQDFMKEDYGGGASCRWRAHYRDFLGKLRRQYPKANIICCTTLLYHDPSWDRAIGQVVREMGDAGITQYLFKRNGKGTPGHLRISEAEEMADELVAYIAGLEMEGWE